MIHEACEEMNEVGQCVRGYNKETSRNRRDGMGTSQKWFASISYDEIHKL